MKLTPTQEMHLRNVKRANDQWRNAKHDAAERARIIAAQEVESFRSAMDHQIRLAFDSGVPKSQLRVLGMGTTSPLPLDDSLARTAASHKALAAELETDALAHRYSFDIDTEILTVTLDGQTLQDARTNARNETGEPSAEFNVSERPDGSRYLNNITQFAAAPTWDQHPVVSWIRDGSEHQAEALAWYAKNVAA